MTTPTPCCGSTCEVCAETRRAETRLIEELHEAQEALAFERDEAAKWKTLSTETKSERDAARKDATEWRETASEWKARAEAAEAALAAAQGLYAAAVGKLTALAADLLAAAKAARYFLKGLRQQDGPYDRHPFCQCRSCTAERGLDAAIAKAEGAAGAGPRP